MTKSDFLFGLALFMVYQELSFTTQYGGAIITAITIYMAFVAKGKGQ